MRRFFDAGGRGSIVNSSRGIIGAWKGSGKGAWKAGGNETVDVGKAAHEAAILMRDELGAVL